MTHSERLPCAQHFRLCTKTCLSGTHQSLSPLGENSDFRFIHVHLKLQGAADYSF